MTTIMWREIGVALGVIVVMFWNVENLFDSFDDPLKNDNEFLPGAERHWTWKRFEAKRDGIAIILISDELTEVLGMADRLLVMKDGRVTKEIRRDEDFTEQSVIGVMI